MANGESRFLALNKLSDWAEGQCINLSISDDGLSIASTTAYAKEKEIELKGLPEEGSVSDFVLAQCDLLFVLDRQAHRLGLLDLNQETCECIECVSKLLSKPVALACTSRTLFVADAESPHRILSLARINWQIRWAVGSLPSSADGTLSLEGFTPICLGIDEDENLYALHSAKLVVAKFDHAGSLVDTFVIDSVLERTITALVLAPTELLYLLDSKNRKVIRIDLRTREAMENFIDFDKLDFPIQPSSMAVDKRGTLYVGDDRPEPQGDEDDRFIHIFASDGTYRGTVSGYRGAVTKLAIDGQGKIIALDSLKGKITVLTLKKKFSRLDDQTLPAGAFFSKVLDSTQPGTLWHKIVIDADIPPNTQVKVYFHTADDKGEFGRTVEDTGVSVQVKRGLAWSRPIINPSDALFLSNTSAQPPKGRYLWLRLEILGSMEETPTVRSIRAYFPRMSYLRYLPAIYQEDGASRGLLERHLSLFETFFANSELQIDHIVRCFDAEAVPGDFLDWLASWLALQIDEVWGEEKKRAFLQRSPDLFTKRGTRAGIEAMIEILTGDRPYLIEQFRLYSAPFDQELEEVLQRLYGTDPYCFCVLLKKDQVKTEDERQALQRLVQAEKPAHTCASVQVLQPWIFLDWHTYLEINTYLSRPTLRLSGGAVMPRDLLLSDVPEAGQIERRSRVELDTELT